MLIENIIENINFIINLILFWNIHVGESHSCVVITTIYSEIVVEDAQKRRDVSKKVVMLWGYFNLINIIRMSTA